MSSGLAFWTETHVENQREPEDGVFLCVVVSKMDFKIIILILIFALTSAIHLIDNCGMDLEERIGLGDNPFKGHGAPSDLKDVR